jgi:hypothetical protein
MMAQDIVELRMALDEAYDAIPRNRFGYTHPIAPGQPIRGRDIRDIRSAVVAIE